MHKLIFQQWCRMPNMEDIWVMQFHDAYTPFMHHVFGDQFGTPTPLSHDAQQHELNNHLMPYNGHVSVFRTDRIEFMFCSESDLTRFVLAWS
jgi:hypothetical protein